MTRQFNEYEIAVTDKKGRTVETFTRKAVSLRVALNASVRQLSKTESRQPVTGLAIVLTRENV